MKKLTLSLIVLLIVALFPECKKEEQTKASTEPFCWECITEGASSGYVTPFSLKSDICDKTETEISKIKKTATFTLPNGGWMNMVCWKK